MAPPVPPQAHQRQHDRQLNGPPTDSHGGPRRGRERWRYLDRDYVRDGTDSEWVEAWKPTIHPVTDIYGFPPGDPLYRPHLRYTPRGPEYEHAQGEQAAVPPVDRQPHRRAMGRAEMPPPHSGSGVNGGHFQSTGDSNATHSRPQPPSPPPMPYRRTGMRKDQSHASYGRSGPSPSFPQDRRSDLRYPTQPNNARAPTGHVNSIGPGAAQQRQDPAATQAPAEPLETREDPWESLFGSKGYTTLAPGDERPFWWDWED